MCDETSIHLKSKQANFGRLSLFFSRGWLFCKNNRGNLDLSRPGANGLVRDSDGGRAAQPGVEEADGEFGDDLPRDDGGPFEEGKDAGEGNEVEDDRVHRDGDAVGARNPAHPAAVNEFLVDLGVDGLGDDDGEEGGDKDAPAAFSEVADGPGGPIPAARGKPILPGRAPDKLRAEENEKAPEGGHGDGAVDKRSAAVVDAVALGEGDPKDDRADSHLPEHREGDEEGGREVCPHDGQDEDEGGGHKGGTASTGTGEFRANFPLPERAVPCVLSPRASSPCHHATLPRVSPLQ